jgi:hypothetical protein
MTLESKLALKGRSIRIIGAPWGVPPEPLRVAEDAEALLVFVRDRRTLSIHLSEIVASAAADRLTWVAYPKGGALGTDLNRDSLAALLQEEGIRPVTQVAIDATWSALRFRPGAR